MHYFQQKKIVEIDTPKIEDNCFKVILDPDINAF